MPARLGLLVTTYLIATNIYCAVEVPDVRGFCFIDTWMIGIQLTILLAIFEYAIVLSLIRSRSKLEKQHAKNIIHVLDTEGTAPAAVPDKKADVLITVEKMDIWAKIILLSFFLIFNGYYWSNLFQ